MRSLLFVPGDDERKLAKAVTSGADALILDLEDSVSPARKAAARASTAAFLAARAGQGGPRLLVRVNPLDSPHMADDLAAVMPGAPAAVMLPKCRGGADVQALGTRLAVAEAELGLVDGATGILAIATETAASLFGMASYQGCSHRLIGLAWGGEDLSADIGAQSNRQADGRYADPYRLARTLTLLAAAAAEVMAVDTVFTALKDAEGLVAECAAAANDGFVAKMAIHPAQVAAINAAFTPSPAAVARARAILDAFAAAPGAGVLAVAGEMVDRPHIRRAERLLARAGVQAEVGRASENTLSTTA